MKNIYGVLCLWLIGISPAFCGGTMGMHMQHMPLDLKDKAALQRGAKLYMNYCSGCHSLKYLRYSQLARGLDLMMQDGKPHRQLLHNNLIFSQAEVFDPIEIAMPEVNSRQWFGVVPPDLSLVSRVRGVDWLYTYLKGFYEDKRKPFGVNNLIFPDVAMPNVLSVLQGRQVAVYQAQNAKHSENPRIDYLQVVEPGLMSQAEFDRSIQDIVTFLSFVGEPLQNYRKDLGVWVLGFLSILLIFSYLLKKTYWREIKKV